MTIEVKLPELGDGIESGDVLEVLVQEGDSIVEDQGIVELETDKATVEVPCSHAGRIVKIHVQIGDTVPIGGTLLTIEAATPAESVAQPETPPPAVAQSQSKKPGPAVAPSVPAESPATPASSAASEESQEPAGQALVGSQLASRPGCASIFLKERPKSRVNLGELFVHPRVVAELAPEFRPAVDEVVAQDHVGHVEHDRVGVLTLEAIGQIHTLVPRQGFIEAAGRDVGLTPDGHVPFSHQAIFASLWSQIVVVGKGREVPMILVNHSSVNGAGVLLGEPTLHILEMIWSYETIIVQEHQDGPVRESGPEVTGPAQANVAQNWRRLRCRFILSTL